MVQHIVLWKLKEFDTPAQRAEAVARIKTGLEALCGVVPGLTRAQVGENFTEGGYDLGLYSEFTDRAALESYQENPAHLAVAEFVRSVRVDRASCDWEA